MGKTTMAAASALHLAISRGEDKKILAISTDPAHSLSDSFGVAIGDRVMEIEYGPKSQIPNLFARELNATRLLDEFKRKNHAIIKRLAKRGTYFDEEDIAGFLELSLPGMDEVMAVIEIADLLKERAYDGIIVDTAPTGHNVRMMNLPDQMLAWIETVELMQNKHRYMTEVFSGNKYRKDACDRFLDDLSSDIDRVRRLLSDRKTTRFVPVMIPEPMSIYETERLVGSLEKNGVPVKEMIVNHVVESGGCAFCRSRREDQEIPLREIEERFPGYDRIRIPVFPHEIRGISGLNTIAEALSGMHVALYSGKRVQMVDAPAGCLTLDPGLEFVLFGGKGGVGKTTLASAAALWLSHRYPEKRVLLFSTDPAHSLSDSLNQPIGDEMTPVQWSGARGQRLKLRGQKTEGRRQDVDGGDRRPQLPITNQQPTIEGLFALEINADRLWKEFKETFKSDIEALFNRFVSRGADIRFDREAMTEIIELAPPGVDEIMALNRIMDLRNEGEFDIFVLDTSPTGHLLRFLELPDLAREWLKVFFGLLLKYKGVVSLAGAAEKALALSKNVRRIQETLTDAKKTDFVATAIPEAMAVSELERLMRALQAGNIPCRHIIVNKAIPETDCGFCSVKRAEQQDYVRKISSIFPDRTIVQVPLFPHQIRGIEDLRELGDAVFCKAGKDA